jgi:3-oxoacyl-[acyl-carrier protein] reductase
VSAAADRVALVTGVSRRRGIGFAVARRLLDDGARVVIHSWTAHDAEQPWGADPDGVAAVVEELGGAGPRLSHVEADLADPAAPAAVVEHAVKAFGAIDVLVANHARSSATTLETVTAQELDRSWAVNARAVVLLVQAYAAQRDHARGAGRVVLFTSGQHLEPMTGELAYAVTKGAVHQMTRTLAGALADHDVTLNAVNPGPVDTGWPSDDLREALRPQFPRGHWGRPEDIAGVVAWLTSAEGGQITGQVIDAEAGFRRHAPADSPE